ncbi:hypothetical protein [Xenorhabdus miraniensis]|uniref:Uncharacterized protein n=1 Tax=Xenorhabdus miraniensis TaxID=351674 RepID=A0A2D0JJ53_9GAMM|nr:hypothetical protein [Xenorhabdus miraniensis]PHM44501.1 hypothetical protein Xmir_04391 [Xenorhabdus miraniensis]
MNRTYSIKNHTLETENFSELCSDTINKKFEKINNKKARKIACLESINNTECRLINSLNLMRRFFMYLYFIGSLIGMGTFINHYLKVWNASETSYIEGASYAKEDYGEYFYLNPNLPEYQKKYEYIAHDKSISLLKYWHIRYSKDGFYSEERARYFLMTDAGFFLLYLFFIIVSFYFLLKVRTIPPFIIDRERQIFYTWLKGKVYVANYAQLEVYNSSGNLGLKTCGYDKNNKLINYFYLPKFPSIFNTNIDIEYLLTFVSKYFVQGKDTVSLVDFKRRGPLFWLREEPKPADWEAQVAAILAEVDRFGPPHVSVSEKTPKERV